MLSRLRNMFRVPDLRNKILFTIFIIAVYRVGAHLPVPYVNFEAIKQLQHNAESNGGVVGFLDLFSGGAITNVAIFFLGIMPYITASIIMQLLGVVIPKLEQWQNEGQVGQKKITQWTRYVTIGIVFVESGQRRIPVQFAKRVVGRRMYGGQSTYIPLKVNQSGVIPVIFASSILSFPALIASVLGDSANGVQQWINDNLVNHQGWFYIGFYTLLIIFFSYFYTAIAFNPAQQ